MKSKESKPELPFPSDKFRLIWEEWLTYRRERKLPTYKPTGLKRTMSGLERDCGGSEESAIRIIINAMEKSWQGLYPVGNNGNNFKIGTGKGQTKNEGVGAQLTGL